MLQTYLDFYYSSSKTKLGVSRNQLFCHVESNHIHTHACVHTVVRILIHRHIRNHDDTYTNKHTSKNLVLVTLGGEASLSLIASVICFRCSSQHTYVRMCTHTQNIVQVLTRTDTNVEIIHI